MSCMNKASSYLVSLNSSVSFRPQVLQGVLQRFGGLTCRCLSVTKIIQSADKPPVSQKQDDESLVAAKLMNKNPRNLEFLGIAQKRKGWNFQYPSKEYYHRLIFERHSRHTTAYVEHSSGRRVVTASTRELAIMRQLFSQTDVSAAENVGHVLARRCLECGITSMVLQDLDNSEKSEKFQAFRAAIVAGGVELSEPEEVRPDYQPGIDYDDVEALDDLERRQWLVYRLGEKSKTMKALNVQQGLRVRRRPMRRPDPLEMPGTNSTQRN